MIKPSTDVPSINRVGNYTGNNNGKESLSEIQLNAGICSLLMSIGYKDQDIRKIIAVHALYIIALRFLKRWYGLLLGFYLQLQLIRLLKTYRKKMCLLPQKIHIVTIVVQIFHQKY